MSKITIRKFTEILLRISGNPVQDERTSKNVKEYELQMTVKLEKWSILYKIQP